MGNLWIQFANLHKLTSHIHMEETAWKSAAYEHCPLLFKVISWLWHSVHVARQKHSYVRTAKHCFPLCLGQEAQSVSSAMTARWRRKTGSSNAGYAEEQVAFFPCFIVIFPSHCTAKAVNRSPNADSFWSGQNAHYLHFVFPASSSDSLLYVCLSRRADTLQEVLRFWLL